MRKNGKDGYYRTTQNLTKTGDSMTKTDNNKQINYVAFDPVTVVLFLIHRVVTCWRYYQGSERHSSIYPAAADGYYQEC